MPKDLAIQFASMSNDEMLHIGNQYASLTDDAQTLVRSEFSRRNLEIPDAEADDEPVAEQGITTLRKYRDQAEALLARSVLESAGIQCFLLNENTIRNDWLWSNLLGGIRLQVSTSDVAAAEALLSQPIPARIAFAGDADYDQPRCPNCSSLDVGRNNFDAKVGATSILLFGFPLPSPVQKDYWHCENCGINWTDEIETSTRDDG